jgi:transcriptional regulator with XRE-family HTH domain
MPTLWGMTAEPIQVPNWTFGDRLRRVRRSAGLNQIQMAERIGVTKAMYVSWETDYNLPRKILAVAARIELEFGTPQWWTLGIPAPGLNSGWRKRLAGAFGAWPEPSPQPIAA